MSGAACTIFQSKIGFYDWYLKLQNETRRNHQHFSEYKDKQTIVIGFYKKLQNTPSLNFKLSKPSAFLINQIGKTLRDRAELEYLKRNSHYKMPLMAKAKAKKS